jgi:hypothetical protein
MATAKKAARKTAVKRQRTPWNASEIVYSVIGYLTTRKAPLFLGGSYDAAPVAEVVGAIVKANNLPPTRKSWKKIHIPDGIENITNVPDGPRQVDGEQKNKLPTAAELLETVFTTLQMNLDRPEQNKFVSGLLAKMGESRREWIAIKEQTRKNVDEELDRSRKIYEEFLQIVKNS